MCGSKFGQTTSHHLCHYCSGPGCCHLALTPPSPAVGPHPVFSTQWLDWVFFMATSGDETVRKLWWISSTPTINPPHQSDLWPVGPGPWLCLWPHFSYHFYLPFSRVWDSWPLAASALTQAPPFQGWKHGGLRTRHARQVMVRLSFSLEERSLLCLVSIVVFRKGTQDRARFSGASGAHRLQSFPRVWRQWVNSQKGLTSVIPWLIGDFVWKFTWKEEPEIPCRNHMHNSFL